MNTPVEQLNQAIELFRQSRTVDAQTLCQSILNDWPNLADALRFEVLHLQGVIEAKLGQFQAAADFFSRATQINRSNAEVYSNLGNVFFRLGNYDVALANYDRAIELKPDYADAYHNRAVMLRKNKKLEAALSSFDQVIRIHPARATAYYDSGVVLCDLRRYEESLERYHTALQLNPQYALAYSLRGFVYSQMQKYDQALADFDRALQLDPTLAETYIKRGTVYQALNRIEPAIAAYQAALQIKPDYPFAYYNLGTAFATIKQYDAAYESYKRAYELSPDERYLFANMLHAKMQVCDWSGFDDAIAKLLNKLSAQQSPSGSFPILSLVDSPAAHKQTAMDYARSEAPENQALGAMGPRTAKKKIRVGYFSADYHEHPVAMLLAGLFEAQDRSRFEVFAFSSGLDTDEPIRQRIKRGVDHFIDINTLSDKEAAQLSRHHGIDIAVDLGGHTKDSRYGVFAFRAAPVQVAYLGFPGTTGATYMDYLVADEVLIAPDEHQHYVEKIVTLPSYQPNDRKREIADQRYTRAEMGLPDTGFVFCCFNDGYKITPEVFDSWMRIMRAVPDSVLWLRANNPWAMANLRQAAQARGVAAERLIFAQRVPTLAEHLARHRLADLFLDTLPYNAHTTASDALWAGLPVLTRKGESFTARVAASVLTAVGLPELITYDSAEYEALAIELAAMPQKLKAIKAKLVERRLSALLFDTALYTRHLESAFTTMIERVNAGLPPEAFVVAKEGVRPAVPAQIPVGKLTSKIKPLSAAVLAKLHTQLLEAVECHRQGEFNKAKALYEAILKLNPLHSDALHLLGVIAVQTGNAKAAIELIGQAIELNPNEAAFYSNRGQALLSLGLHEAALNSFEKAIALNAEYAEAYNNRGVALKELHRWPEALASYDHAIRLRPDYADVHKNRGQLLKAMNRLPEAVASYDRAIECNPKYAEAYFSRGNALRQLNQLSLAVVSYDQAIACRPDYIDAYLNRGATLNNLKQTQLAIDSFRNVVRLDSHFNYVHGMLLNLLMKQCDWHEFDTGVRDLTEQIAQGRRCTTPFAVVALTDRPDSHLRATQLWVQDQFPMNPSLGSISKYSVKPKLRIGYFSSDFREHPVSVLLAGLFESHDRSRFELFAFASGQDSNDPMRRRAKAAFDHFIDVHTMSDQSVAQLARQLEINIAIDLGGHTKDARLGIFSYRAAPIQLSYVGYLGTMGAEYYDYLIADSTLISENAQQYYSEKIIYLPSYQANDAKRLIADKVFTRTELGLPESGFVFCCFNNQYKITPPTFDSWMKILRAVPDSVLMLFADNDTAKANLRQEAQLRGVAAERIVFGEHLPLSEHLARYRMMGLFLDTWPYNAGATASDALWAGLPVLTYMGESFASRYAASLLTAMQMPELITNTPAAYEALAIELATDSRRLAELRLKLQTHRLTTKLFDTHAFTQSIEAAYEYIHQRYQDDLPPEHVYV